MRKKDRKFFEVGVAPLPQLVTNNPIAFRRARIM
jgi:hypothetical protein